MLLDIIQSMFIAVVIVTIFVCVVAVIVKTKAGKIGAVFTAFMILLFAVALATGHAEGQRGTVVICYPNEIPDKDIFIIEYDNGERDIYDHRGDLVPGDKLIVNGDETELYQQTSWIYFEFKEYDDVLAMFLYPEDAKQVAEHFEELP